MQFRKYRSQARFACRDCAFIHTSECKKPRCQALQAMRQGYNGYSERQREKVLLGLLPNALVEHPSRQREPKGILQP